MTDCFSDDHHGVRGGVFKLRLCRAATRMMTMTKTTRAWIGFVFAGALATLPVSAQNQP